MKRQSGLFVILILMLVALAACEKPAQRKVSTSNASIDVQELFVKDGCTVYRFYDNGDAVYFVRCGSQAEMSWNKIRTSGKVTYVQP